MRLLQIKKEDLLNSYSLGAVNFKLYFHSKNDFVHPLHTPVSGRFQSVLTKMIFIKQRINLSKMKNINIWVEILLLLLKTHVQERVLKRCYCGNKGERGRVEGRDHLSLDGHTHTHGQDFPSTPCYHIWQMKSTQAPKNHGIFSVSGDLQIFDQEITQKAGMKIKKAAGWYIVLGCCVTRLGKKKEKKKKRNPQVWKGANGKTI